MTEPTEWGQAKLARIVAEELAGQKKRVRRVLFTDEIDTEAFWSNETKRMTPAIALQLQAIAERAAMNTGQGVGLVTAKDTGGTIERVLAWVSRYTFDLVTRINGTTRDVIRRAITSFYEEEGYTRGQVEEMIMTSSRTFSPSRASSIAVTETTRAYYEGGEASMQEARDLGIEFVSVWNTNRSGTCCDECSRRDQTARYGGPNGTYEYGWSDPPPIHPNCQCKVTYELP